MKKVTLKTIAEKLDISQNTVSVALRGHPGIKQETRQLILDTAMELGYSPKKNSPAFNVLVVTTENTEKDTYFFHNLFVGIQKEVSERKSNLIIIDTSEIKCSNQGGAKIEEIILSNSICGIMVLGDIDKDICNKLTKTNIPVVGVSYYCPGVNMSAVIEDNICGAALITQHLVELGYRNIGFIGDLSNISFWERFISYRATIEKFGLRYNPELCIVDAMEDEISDFHYVARRFYYMKKMPDACVCANDKLAAVAIKAAYIQGYKVPEDLGMVGFDNNDIAKLSMPTITTVDTYREEQAIKAVNLLWKLMEGKKRNNLKIVLPISIIEGNTTRKQEKTIK